MRPIWGRRVSCGCFSELRAERKHSLPLHPRLSPTPAIWRSQGWRGPDSWKSVRNKKAHDPRQSWPVAQGTSLQRPVALSSTKPDPNLESLSAEVKETMALNTHCVGSAVPKVKAGGVFLSQGAWPYLVSAAESGSHMNLLPHNTVFQPGDTSTVLVCNRLLLMPAGQKCALARHMGRSSWTQAAAVIPEQGLCPGLPLTAQQLVWAL